VEAEEDPEVRALRAKARALAAEAARLQKAAAERARANESRYLVLLGIASRKAAEAAPVETARALAPMIRPGDLDNPHLRALFRAAGMPLVAATKK
jgi:hypothetical protein